MCVYRNVKENNMTSPQENILKCLYNLKDNKELIQEDVAQSYVRLSDDSVLETCWGICIYIEPVELCNYIDLGKYRYYEDGVPIADRGFDCYYNIYLNEERWVFIDWCIDQLEGE